MKTTLADLKVDRPAEGIERRRLNGRMLEFIDYRYQPGSKFPMHAHDAEQFTIVQEGVLVFVFEDGEVRLGPGEAVLIEGGRPHGAFVPPDAVATRTYNVFTPVREQPPGGP